MMLWFDRHRRLHDQLSAYIDGALNPDAARRLEAHLGECEGCRTELEQLRSTVAALRELPEARVPRPFALSPERAAAPRPSILAAPLVFGTRVAAAGVAVALAAVLVVDLGDLAGDGATEEVSAPQMTSGREADEADEGGEDAAGEETPTAGMMDERPPDEDGLDAADGATEGGAGGAALEPSGTPAAAEGGDKDADAYTGDTATGEATAAEPEEAEAPAAAPSHGGGIDALTAAEIGLAAGLGLLIVSSLALAFAGRKR